MVLYLVGLEQKIVFSLKKLGISSEKKSISTILYCQLKPEPNNLKPVKQHERPQKKLQHNVINTEVELLR